VIFNTEIKKMVYEGETFFLVQQILDVGICWYVRSFKEKVLPMLAKIMVSTRDGVSTFKVQLFDRSNCKNNDSIAVHTL